MKMDLLKCFCTWMLILMPYALDVVNYVVLNYTEMISPYTPVNEWGDNMSPVPIALSFFHTGFNLLNVLLN